MVAGARAHFKGEAHYDDLATVKTLNDTPTAGNPLSAIDGAIWALFQAVGGKVRYRYGADPTTVRGSYLADGQYLELDTLEDDLRFIAEAAGAKAAINYFGL